MIGVTAFVVILSTSICGYVGTSAWIVLLAALGLAGLSAIEHRGLYAEVRTVGLSALADECLLSSVLNGLLATGIAFGGGVLGRLFLFI